jgi:hypothetical protein
VFHPANEYPVRTSTPLFDATVTDAPTPYAPTSDGTLPPVEPLPEYVTPYVTAVHFAYNVTLDDPIVNDDAAA